MKLINLAQISGGKALETDVNSLKTQLATLTEGSGEGSVASQVAAALAEAKTYADQHELTTVVSAADASVSVSPSTSGNVTTYSAGVAISADTGNALTLAADGLKVVIPASAEYSVARATTADTGYLATYQLTKDGVATGDKINIPKDYLVKSATVGTITVADTPVAGAVGDKYLDFVVNTQDNDETASHIYLNVKDLTDVYVGSDTLTGNSAPTEVSVSVDANNVISASLVNGGVSLAKLATDVTNAIDAAEQAGLDASAALTTYQTSNDAALDAVAGRMDVVEDALGLGAEAGETTVASRLADVEDAASDNADAISVLNGDANTTGSVAKTVKDAVDTAVTNIGVTTSALDTRITANTTAITDGVAEAKAYTDVLALNIPSKFDKFTIDSSTATTVFTLTSIPNAEKIIVYINHMAYLEDEAMFTVNRANKTVTWTATSANGGFDIDNTLTDEVFIKYNTYVIPTPAEP